MGKTIFWLVIAGFVIVLTLLIFPPVHTVLNEVDTSEFSTLLTAMVTGLPYALIGIAIYLAVKAVKGGG